MGVSLGGKQGKEGGERKGVGGRGEGLVKSPNIGEFKVANYMNIEFGYNVCLFYNIPAAHWCCAAMSSYFA